MTCGARLLIFGAYSVLAACSSVDQASVEVTAEASGNAYFSLSRPNVFKTGDRLALTGRVCRRGRTTLLSPYRVRLEHLTSGGKVVDTARAGVGPIYGRPDQACASYSARVAWKLGEGDTVDACFEHGRSCPVDPSAKAVIDAPATTFASPPKW